MIAMSTPPSDAPQTKHARRFVCRDELYQAFQERARELECSVDWLIAEAMKRFLSQTGTGIPPRRQLDVERRPRPHLPPPLPPPLSPPRDRIALRLGDQRTVVDQERFVIGRKKREAAFVVADPNVSRQHAMLERTREGWVILDMASTNGVFVNGTRVTRALVRVGDVVVIGPARIIVERA